MTLQTKKKGDSTYFKLRISCPVCHDQGRNTPQTYWIHHNCGGALFVGDNAHYDCDLCNANSHVMGWSYYCPEHSGDRVEFLKASPQGLAQAVSTAGQMVAETGNKWLIKFLESLDNV